MLQLKVTKLSPNYRAEQQLLIYYRHWFDLNVMRFVSNGQQQSVVYYTDSIILKSLNVIWFVHFKGERGDGERSDPWGLRDTALLNEPLELVFFFPLSFFVEDIQLSISEQSCRLVLAVYSPLIVFSHGTTYFRIRICISA